jgi:hypothetical protein
MKFGRKKTKEKDRVPVHHTAEKENARSPLTLLSLRYPVLKKSF